MNFNPVFVIGAPRSGTTYLAKHLGQLFDHALIEHTDFMPQVFYRNGWRTYPKSGTVLIKWCHLYECFPDVLVRFPNAGFVYIRREDVQVLYSMCEPKKDSYPFRAFGELGQDREERFFQALAWWRTHRDGCDRITNCVPDRSCVVDYTALPDQSEQLSRFLGVDVPPFDDFVNRNVGGLRVVWDSDGPKFEVLK